MYKLNKSSSLVLKLRGFSLNKNMKYKYLKKYNSNLISVKNYLSSNYITTKAGYTMSPIMIQVISNVPLLAFGYVLTAPLITCNKIKREKTVSSFNSFPFVSLLGNSGVWTTYGLICMDSTVLIANSIGFVAGSYFTYIYNKFKPIPLHYWTFALGMNIFSICCFFGLSKELALTYLGIAGDATAIILLSSPLV